MSELKQNSFGVALRRRREELGLSLDDVATSTRVRKTYLHALEEENLKVLPGQAYVMGFLRIYARQLGLPVEPLLVALSGVENAADDQPVIGKDSPRMSKKVRKKGAGGRFGFLLFLLILLAASYLYFKPLNPKLETPAERPAPAVAKSPALPPQPAVVSPPSSPPVTPEQPGVAPTELPVLPVGGAVVRMLPSGAGVMKVTLDNQETREYSLQPEQSLNWKVTSSLTVELSAPGLVRVWIDQQELPVADYPAFTLKNIPRQERR